MSLADLGLRIVLAFVALLFLTRIMGRKELSQMTFFNFVSAITIGSIASSLVTIQTFSIRNGVLALVGWTILTLITAFLDIKSKTARLVLTGSPLIVIQKGKIMENALRKARLDINSLLLMLRQQNVFSVMDVEYAIFETNGKLSVMKKEDKKTVTKGDMQIAAPIHTYPIATEVVADGKANKENLKKLNLDEKWLNHQLQLAGVHSLSQVFFAEVQQDGSLYVDRNDEHVH